MQANAGQEMIQTATLKMVKAQGALQMTSKHAVTILIIVLARTTPTVYIESLVGFMYFLCLFRMTGYGSNSVFCQNDFVFKY